MAAVKTAFLAAILAIFLGSSAWATVTCTANGSGFCCDGTVAASPSSTQVFAANDVPFAGSKSPRNSMLVQNLAAKGGVDVYCDFNSGVTAGHGFWLQAGGGNFSWNAPNNTPNTAFYCTGNGGTQTIHGCDN